ncbi:uncharacterized, partial [Tachysurus ichikawai]
TNSDLLSDAGKFDASGSFCALAPDWSETRVSNMCGLFYHFKLHAGGILLSEQPSHHVRTLYCS